MLLLMYRRDIFRIPCQTYKTKVIYGKVHMTLSKMIALFATEVKLNQRTVRNY